MAAGAAVRIAVRELYRTAAPKTAAKTPATRSQPTAASRPVTRPQSCATVVSKPWAIWPRPDWQSAALGAAST